MDSTTGLTPFDPLSEGPTGPVVKSLEACRWCGGEAIEGSTCPKSLECPKCGAAAGSSCRRPSGHRAMTLHSSRIDAAEAIDAAAGILEEPTLELEQLELDEGDLAR